MSAVSVTYAVAKTLAGVAGMQAAYAATVGAAGDTTVKPIAPGADITVTPAALVTYDHFELRPGSLEEVGHYINGDLYFSAATVAEVENTMLPFIDLSIAAFRSSAAFTMNPKVVKIQRGGPAYPVVVNTKDFVVFPLTIYVLEMSPQTYT
jgi:hypothetical protein